jgi:peptidoglycan/LPS O-acetylase OafA/YrhL
VLTWGLAAMLIVSGVVFWSPSIQSLIEFTSRLLIRLGGHARPSVEEQAGFQVLLVVTVFAGGWISYQFVEWPMIRWLQAKL